MLLFRWAQCRSAQPLLWDYASERLSEEIMERVEQHLQQCASCGKELDSLKRAQGLLAACRAQEEPAPRSDWNDLQQRLVADGLAQIAPDSVRRSHTPARRERVATTSRAPWTLQLATSAAGGFAAVLVVALSYNALHLHGVPGAGRGVDTSLNSPNTVAAIAPPAPMQATQPPTDNAQSMQLVSDVFKLLNSVAPRDTAVADSAMSASVRRSNVSTPEPKGNAPVTVNWKRNERRPEGRVVRGVNRVSAQPSSLAVRRPSADKTFAALRETLKTQNYKIKPKKRATDAPPMQLASRYALERVQPVGTDSDETNGYIVGSVRPIARDDEGVY